MNNFGKKLLIPYVAGKATAVLSLDPDVLFYCGYALISDDEQELRVLKRFLESDAFWYYIFHTSKPYAKGYMAFAKNYLVNFTIPIMTLAEQQELLSLWEMAEDETLDDKNKVAVYLLLDVQASAQHYFEKLNDDQQEELKNYPIFNFWEGE